MPAHHLPLDLTIAQLGKGIMLLRNINPWRNHRSDRDPLAQHLERLALTAPHVLVDIGFEQIVLGDTPDVTLWRRGRLRVSVRGTPPDVVVTRT